MSDTRSAVIGRTSDDASAPSLHLGITASAPRTPPARWTLDDIDTVQLGRGPRATRRERAGRDRVLHVALPDELISTSHARLSKLGGQWVLEDTGSKNGTRVAGRDTKRKKLEDGDVIEIGETFLVFRDRGGELPDLDGPPPEVVPGIATQSGELVEQLERLRRTATSLLPIVIGGETGAGKELAARALHALSGRSGKLVAVNCGAIAPTLVEGELFGHRKGAYSGADVDRAGLVRSADRGTLFLDEVAELPLAAQAALLRVLQEGEVLALGADRATPVDLRVVCATHRDLEALVAKGAFREDLYARLAGVTVELIPLRDRTEDLAHLIAAALSRDVVFAPETVRAIYAHPWPRNVRELLHAVEAALALGGSRIEPRDLPAALQPSPRPPEPVDAEDRALRDALVAALERHAGSITAVAKELGKDRTQIRRWVRRFGLSR